jgi:hypothetical protein
MRRAPTLMHCNVVRYAEFWPTDQYPSVTASCLQEQAVYDGDSQLL